MLGERRSLFPFPLAKTEILEPRLRFKVAIRDMQNVVEYRKMVCCLAFYWGEEHLTNPPKEWKATKSSGIKGGFSRSQFGSLVRASVMDWRVWGSIPAKRRYLGCRLIPSPDGGTAGGKQLMSLSPPSILSETRKKHWGKKGGDSMVQQFLVVRIHRRWP